MSLISAKKIREWFNLDHSSKNPQKDVYEITKLISEAEKGNVETIDAALEEIDNILGTHGVEALCGNVWDRYYENIVLLYVNTGDLYNPTLIYKVDDGKFYLTTLGDWQENPRNQKKYGPFS